MTKHRLRNAWRSMRAQSKLSLPQVMATSLAAITMAIVSARLTSFSSSLLIVGVISAISAFASEFYRIVITASAETTKKAVAPILEGELLAGDHHESGQAEDAADSTAGAQTASETAVGAQTASDATVVRVAPAGDLAFGGEGDEGKPSRPSAAGARLVAGSADETAVGAGVAGSAGAAGSGGSGGSEGATGAASVAGAGGAHTRVAVEEPRRKHPFVHALMHNQLLQMSIIFLVVALMTVGVSYAVARAQGKTEINNSYTTVQQSLSEEDKQRIAEEAAEKARQDAAKGGTETPAELTEETPTDESLQTQLDNLKAENESLQTSITDLTAELEAEKARTDDLSARLAALEQQGVTQTPSTETTPTG